MTELDPAPPVDLPTEAHEGAPEPPVDAEPEAVASAGVEPKTAETEAAEAPEATETTAEVAAPERVDAPTEEPAGDVEAPAPTVVEGPRTVGRFIADALICISVSRQLVEPIRCSWLRLP